MKRRIIAIFLATIMCFITATTAFATEPETSKKATCYNLEVSSNGVISCSNENGDELPVITPRSTISGYENANITSDHAFMMVDVEASGWGGMGITIKTSSDWKGNFYVSADAMYINSFADLFDRKQITSNGENYFEDLFHRTPSYILFSFYEIPPTATINVQIWVYG